MHSYQYHKPYSVLETRERARYEKQARAQRRRELLRSLLLLAIPLGCSVLAAFMR